VQWLNPQAFASPASGLQGNLGRNSLRAPGFYSADCALSRSLRIPRAGETWSLTLRAEVFNLLNHSNLDRPVNDLADGAFGVALYGRHGSQPSFPAMAPLDETPRRIRLGIQIAF
jgi:hypothetical protein